MALQRALVGIHALVGVVVAFPLSSPFPRFHLPLLRARTHARALCTTIAESSDYSLALAAARPRSAPGSFLSSRGPPHTATSSRCVYKLGIHGLGSSFSRGASNYTDRGAHKQTLTQGYCTPRGCGGERSRSPTSFLAGCRSSTGSL